MIYTEVLPKLWLGSSPESAADVEHLRQERGITAVLNLQTDLDTARRGVDWRVICRQYVRMNFQLRRVPVSDSPDGLRENIARALQLLDELLRKGHTTYIHCTGDGEHSSTVVVAYLHRYKSWQLTRAIDYVQSLVACNPNIDAIQPIVTVPVSAGDCITAAL